MDPLDFESLIAQANANINDSEEEDLPGAEPTAAGDTPEKTLKRKMAETLGLSGVNPKLKRQYIRESKTEKESVYVFTVVSEEDLPLPPEGKDYVDLFAKD